jgi:hypothetical protein
MILRGAKRQRVTKARAREEEAEDKAAPVVVPKALLPTRLPRRQRTFLESKEKTEVPLPIPIIDVIWNLAYPPECGKLSNRGIQCARLLQDEVFATHCQAYCINKQQDWIRALLITLPTTLLLDTRDPRKKHFNQFGVLAAAAAPARLGEEEEEEEHADEEEEDEKELEEMDAQSRRGVYIVEFMLQDIRSNVADENGACPQRVIARIGDWYDLRSPGRQPDEIVRIIINNDESTSAMVKIEVAAQILAHYYPASTGLHVKFTWPNVKGVHRPYHTIVIGLLPKEAELYWPLPFNVQTGFTILNPRPAPVICV